MEQLTIAIPVFERYQYFEKALNSALNQTQQCSVLVVDNASSHSFFENSCLKKGVKYYRNHSNIGMFANWNKCFELADSEFVLILGDDDMLELDYAERFSNALIKYPDLDLYYSDFSIITYPTLRVSSHNHVLPFGYSSNGNNILEYGVRYKLGFPVITSAIKKSKFSGFYFQEHGSNDWNWAYTNIKDFKIFGDNKRLLYRGHHDSNDSGNIKTQQRTSISIAYIYSKLYSVVWKDELKNVAESRSKMAFLYFLSIAERSYLIQLKNSSLLYAEFFKIMLVKCHLRRIVFLPLIIRKNLYRIGTRLGLVDKM